MTGLARMIGVAAIALLPVQAVACGAADLPCEIEGGVYHGEAPDGEGPHPGVVFLHGYGGRGAGVIGNRGLVTAFLGRGYAVIAPQGVPRRKGETGGTWNARGNPGSRDDVAFLRAVAADAVERFDLDPGRIVLAGFSLGGMMTWRVACSEPEAFAAYAPIAGVLWRPLPKRCSGPVRLYHTHGWSDPVVPLEGRIVGSGIRQGDVFAGLSILRDTARCETDAPDGFGRVGPYQIRRWESCAEGSALAMALHPGGHAIPKGWSGLVLDWVEGE